MSNVEELKKNFLAALRSGKYTQGRDYLRSKDDKFCCLGVLCDVVGVEWADHSKYYGIAYHNNVAGLPHEMLGISDIGHFKYDLLDEKAKTYYDALRVKYRHNVHCLTALNDTGASFEEIAVVIEHCWRCNAFV